VVEARHTSLSEEASMANREQRGNHEKRKPKAAKPKPASGQVAPFAQAAGFSRPKEPGSNKSGNKP
jgi:hypothetical protein